MSSAAQKLADQTLAEFNGDYRKALAELKYQLDPENSALNEVILDAIEDLKKTRAQQYG